MLGERGPMIKLSNLSKSFGTKVLFDKLDYQFPVGKRIALVGSNGAGKSTLLSMITGQLESDHGSIVIPKEMELGFLPQEPNQNPLDTVTEEAMNGPGRLQVLKRNYESALKSLEIEWTPEMQHRFDGVESAWIHAGGPGMESKAKGVLTGLGFSREAMLKNPRSLSGGWRMRLELAKIFINQPDFLILDEPTNHLDLPSLMWVEKWLMNFKGTLLFVSHDRELLNRLGEVTLHLANRSLTPYAGNFDYFLEARELKQEQDAKAAEGLRKRRESLEEFVTKYGAKASKAAQAKSKAKLIDRLRSMEVEFDKEDDTSAIGFSFPKPANCGRDILRVESLSIGYDKVLAKAVTFAIEKGQKVAVIGANGIGKSTLLKTVSRHIASLSGEFQMGQNVLPIYFAQDQLEIFDSEKTVFESIMATSDLDIGQKQIMNILGSFLFRGTDANKKVKVLSGGEKSRLGLACLLTQKSNFLLLDEPTNHLDMSSASMLSSALDNYEGSALFVSHDRDFINTVATHILVMLPDGRSRIFEGNLGDYERLAAVQGFPNVLASADEPSNSHDGRGLGTSAPQSLKGDSEHAIRQAEKKERQKKERELRKTEEEIVKYQSELSKIEALLNDAEKGHQEISQLTIKFDEHTKRLQELEEKWLVLSEGM
jgi:ATP-binding cassette subfamily F protein 3